MLDVDLGAGADLEQVVPVLEGAQGVGGAGVQVEQAHARRDVVGPGLAVQVHRLGLLDQGDRWGVGRDVGDLVQGDDVRQAKSARELGVGLQHPPRRAADEVPAFLGDEVRRQTPVGAQHPQEPHVGHGDDHGHGRAVVGQLGDVERRQPLGELDAG